MVGQMMYNSRKLRCYWLNVKKLAESILTKLYPDPGPMTSDEVSFLLVAEMENPPFSSCKSKWKM